MKRHAVYSSGALRSEYREWEARDGIQAEVRVGRIFPDSPELVLSEDEARCLARDLTTLLNEATRIASDV